MNLWEFVELLKMGCTCAKESIRINNQRFFLISRLGEGGFSFVDLIQDSKSRKYFALKRIVCHSEEDKNDALKEAEYMNRFDQLNLLSCEESTVVPISHPKKTVICEVLIAMPYHRKGTIQDEIERLARKSEHLKEERILKILRGICEGLKTLHSHSPSISHRDMKPSNVLLSDDDTPVLMDFGSMGLARIEIKTSREARALQDLAAERCTMPYRAPELFNVGAHSMIDERIDIWSLGCTLYSMCYLEGPFEQDYQRGGSIALAVLRGIKGFPDKPQYSQNVKDLITHMTAISIAERPYIDQIIDKLDLLLNQQQNRV